MTAGHSADEIGFGPYTVLDLHELPEDGKGFELEDGWLIEVAAGARHNWIARRLSRIIEAAAEDASVIVLDGGEWEISTPSGVRKPDVLVLPKDVGRAAIVDEAPKIIPGTDVLLVVEVISPGSSSERTDRVRKVREYAALGIPEYWIVEHRPSLRVRRSCLVDGEYRWEPVVAAGAIFTGAIEADQMIRVSFDPATLIDY
ncbi:Uma2 family endonuclease [Nocardia otitidiscaviarum]|uniref:Uma2 family endonuclease n=1 Tax=Nocardia otitidiscaviarum TaxID=1823 RepID=UPI0004A6DC51|nr:Uma2 family endonuclease [Nocardia otitidiscaviarum]MBF6132868.1 Uma2 family endonuclease [Nocardia otitidiscaviarum]MBF6486263.1 Uma2 family endonuclease [Nocardia otitidiscaviarum]